ncbi:DUF3068 domain-containing protein [Sphaerisporangium fuscum]|uniref:DUF3068 domain-containing protein n=1 Tax=Sphaerisporangium fuscum TaxID=2835868 RepID=UPI001BDC4FC4|nr:DUF3068 domain-containing protein [Sphaerisporangium fuscum]
MTRTDLRQTAALICVGAGAFLLTLVPLLRVYVYAQVIRTPLEQSSVVRMYARTATFFDPATMRLRNRPVVLTRVLTGDAKAGNADRAVWTEYSSLTTLEGARIDYAERRVAFDRRTGAIVNCCGEYVDDDTTVHQSGLAFRWPFGAEKRAYEYFDPELRRAVPIAYDGTEKVAGVLTYRYKQQTPPAELERLATPIPAKVLGLPGKRSYQVSRWGRTTRTIWVEPVSGVPVKAEEDIRQSFRTPDGVDRLVALRADLRTPEEDVAVSVGEASAFSSWSTWIRVALPIAGGIAGLGLIGAGIWLRRRSAPAKDQQEVPRHDLANSG